MKRLINILFTLPLLMIWGCTDSMDDGATGGRGTMTIQLSGGNLSVATRADQTQDHEFYMDDVQLFFYPGNSQTEAAAFALRDVSVDAYGSKDIVVGLSDDDLAKIFPGSNTTCTVYAVSNVANSSDIDDAASIETIKATAITATVTDFKNSAWSIPMSGMGTVTLNRTNMTVSGNIEMERSVAKITLDVSIKNEIETDDGTYIFEKDENDVTAYIYNGARTGLIDGMAAADKRNYTRLSDGKAVYTLGYKAAESSPVGSSDYTLKTPFYSYPNEWESESSSNETTLRLKVPWKKSGEREWTTYYYRVPINDVDHKLDRNTHYRIKLNVGMLGSKVPSTPVTLDDFTYEILSWSEDDIDLMQDLSTAQYLVVEENTFELVNTSDAVIRYNSSAVLSGVYLRSVSYYSTSYNDTVYLYDTNNDETYTETSSYSPNSKSVQAKYSTAVSEIKDNVKNALGFESDMSGDTYLGSGQINFSANVQNIAAEVYRPVTYTIVLVASDINSRVTVKLTQYPSKYIEFGAGGNVFVNGYFARLAPDSGYDTSSDSWPAGSKVNDTEYYRSYHFTYSNYNSDGKYYYSSDDNRFNRGGVYGPNQVSTNNYLVNTSYEFLQGQLIDLTFEHTVDVYVSAFSSSDNSYTVSTGAHTYVIGDPRENGTFVADNTHTTGSYSRTETELYDYYTGGSTESNQYRRYVSPWTNAPRIKVGGTTSKYDDIIAPMFKIQSSYGTAKSQVYFDVAQKRCATYQEAGYPAGRWRLPTLAEIAYIVKLQNEGVIEKMFNSSGDGGYWTSSGGKIVANSNMTYTANYKNTSSGGGGGNGGSPGGWVRCVYDTWYWGNKQTLPTHQYHPMP